MTTTSPPFPAVIGRVLCSAAGLALLLSACASDGRRVVTPTAPTISPSMSSLIESASVPGDAPPSVEDPDGTDGFSLDVPADWDATDVPADGGLMVAAWFVGPEVSGFTPNVNVIRESTPGVTLEEYTEYTKKHIPADYSLVSIEMTTSSSGAPISKLEYRSEKDGLSFLATTDVRNGSAFTATYTAPTDVFATQRADIEKVLLTLAADE